MLALHLGTTLQAVAGDCSARPVAGADADFVSRGPSGRAIFCESVAVAGGKMLVMGYGGRTDVRSAALYDSSVK